MDATRTLGSLAGLFRSARQLGKPFSRLGPAAENIAGFGAYEAAAGLPEGAEGVAKGALRGGTLGAAFSAFPGVARLGGRIVGGPKGAENVGRFMASAGGRAATDASVIGGMTAAQGGDLYDVLVAAAMAPIASRMVGGRRGISRSPERSTALVPAEIRELTLASAPPDAPRRAPLALPPGQRALPAGRGESPIMAEGRVPKDPYAPELKDRWYLMPRRGGVEPQDRVELRDMTIEPRRPSQIPAKQAVDVVKAERAKMISEVMARKKAEESSLRRLAREVEAEQHRAREEAYAQAERDVEEALRLEREGVEPQVKEFERSLEGLTREALTSEYGKASHEAVAKNLSGTPKQSELARRKFEAVSDELARRPAPVDSKAPEGPVEPRKSRPASGILEGEIVVEPAPETPFKVINAPRYVEVRGTRLPTRITPEGKREIKTSKGWIEEPHTMWLRRPGTTGAPQAKPKSTDYYVGSLGAGELNRAYELAAAKLASVSRKTGKGARRAVHLTKKAAEAAARERLEAFKIAFNAPVRTHLKGVPLDKASRKYQQDGDFDAYVKEVAKQYEGTKRDVSEMKILGDTHAGSLGMANRTYFGQEASAGIDEGVITRLLTWSNKAGDIAKYKWTDQYKNRLGQWAATNKPDKGFFDRAQDKAHRNDPDVKEYREILADARADANKMRTADGREQIGFLEDYMPHVAEVSQMARAFGKMGEVFGELPDFVHFKTVKNPRALKRRGAEMKMEKDPVKLADQYINQMSKDIFNTQTIRHNRALAKLAEKNGLSNTAKQILEYTDVIYGGKKPFFTNRANAHPLTRVPFDLFAKAVSPFHKAVFGFNIAWTTGIQITSGIALTPSRYGYRNATAAIALARDPAFREWVSKTHGIQTKVRRGGRVWRTDMSDMDASLKTAITQGKFEKYSNAYSQLVERELSIHASAAAYIRGRQLGFKGRRLEEFVSEAAIKTQGAYNWEDKPFLLTNREVGLLAPFQSFKFDLWNHGRELVGNIGGAKVGTGAWRTAYKSPKTGRVDPAERVRAGIRLMVGMYIANLWSQAVLNRDSYGPESMLPFGELFGALGFEDEVEGSRAPYWGGKLLPKQVFDEFYEGVRRGVVSGNWEKLIDAFTRYRLPGGAQGRRMKDAIKGLLSGELTAPEAAYGAAFGKRAIPGKRPEKEDKFFGVVPYPWDMGEKEKEADKEYKGRKSTR